MDYESNPLNLVSKLKMAASVDSIEIFNNLATKIGNLKVVRTEGDWDIFSRTLDELNSINYRYTVVTSPIVCKIEIITPFFQQNILESCVISEPMLQFYPYRR